ncbi:protein kinase [Leifsonia poae]|uniref:protein kinase n=1 Tax=Leifsonia poae TaxID=110933 RepID=UPI003D66AA3E
MTENLARSASALALRHGLELQRTLSHDESELRQLVVVSGTGQQADFCVRGSGEGALEATRTEIEALRATRSEHVLQLIDVLPRSERGRRARAGPPPALLLEYAPGGDLATFLERRDSIRAGEASTILLSMAQGLAELHRGEWAHGGLTATCVVFRRDGCPAIRGLDTATPLTVRTLYDDRSAFLQVAERVTDAISGGEGSRMLAAVHDALGRSGWAGVTRVLLDGAEPEAVLMPFRVEAPHPEPAQAEGARFGSLLDGNPLAGLKASVGAWAGRRKKLIAVALSPIALSAVVLAILPGGGGSAGAEAGAVESAGAAPSASPTPSKTAITRAVPPGTPTVRPSTVPDAGDESEDPVRAAERLLAERHGCFAAKHPDSQCLQGSEQAGSPLLLSDSEAIVQAGASSERDLRGATLELEERWGDAALLSMTPPSAESGSQEGTGKANRPRS